MVTMGCGAQTEWEGIQKSVKVRRFSNRAAVPVKIMEAKNPLKMKNLLQVDDELMNWNIIKNYK